VKPTLQVIVGSSRPGRVGFPIATWFADIARQHGAFEVELVDLAEVNLPMLDESRHPRFAQYEHQHTTQWSATIARGDAYVFVTPEYNRGFSGVLKNAIDYLMVEWAYKPAGIVSYGGVSGGTRAANMLIQVLSGLRLIILQEAVNIPFVGTLIRDGEFMPGPISIDAAVLMLDELHRALVNSTGLRK
jgi:NAD(P)H-dependent FMN reductase